MSNCCALSPNKPTKLAWPFVFVFQKLHREPTIPCRAIWIYSGHEAYSFCCDVGASIRKENSLDRTVFAFLSVGHPKNKNRIAMSIAERGAGIL